MIVRDRFARRFATAALLAVLALATSVRPAFAVFGIGDIVYDPANFLNAKLRYAQLILQGAQLGRQLVVTTRQANHIIQQARGFNIGRLHIPSLGEVLEGVDRRYGRGESLGYGSSQLDALFRRTFPGVAAWNRRAAGQQADAAREAAFNLLLSTRDQHLQITRSQRRLDQLKAELSTATTDRQVAQLQNMIAAEQLDQQLMERNLEMGSANLQAVDAALRADQAARAAMEDTAKAVYGVVQQNAQEAAARRVVTRQDSIARARRSRLGSGNVP